MVFNLFHTVAHLGQNSGDGLKKNLYLDLSAISQFSSQKQRSSLKICSRFFDPSDFIIHMAFVLICAVLIL